MTTTSVKGYTDSRGRQVKGYTQNRNGTGAKPKPKSQRTRRAIGGSVAGVAGVNFLASGFNFGSSLFNFGAAVFTVAGASLLAWGGYKAHKKRKRRKSTNQLGLPRATVGPRKQTPAQIRAKAQAKLEKKQLRHDLHKDWFASLFGPARVTKSDWSETEAKQTAS